MTLNTNSAEKLILALDGMNKEEVISLIARLPNLVWVKIGLELFVREGPDLLAHLRDNGKKIFLDLKFHDIPATMSKACFMAAQTGAQLITVHACAGSKSLKLANEAAKEGALKCHLPPPTLLAVTVLTSWDDYSFAKDIFIDESINSRVERMAALAFKTGIGGCVCSPIEVQNLRRLFPEPFQLITPGIRNIGSSQDDQARVMTATNALKAGSSRLVIGRLITKAKDPVESFNVICDEIDRA